MELWPSGRYKALFGRIQGFWQDMFLRSRTTRLLVTSNPPWSIRDRLATELPLLGRNGPDWAIAGSYDELLPQRVPTFPRVETRVDWWTWYPMVQCAMDRAANRLNR